MNLKVLSFFVLMLALGSAIRPPKRDIIFVIDINEKNIELAKESALLILDHESISPETSRVSLITISNKSILKFHFSSFVNRECVENRIQNLKPSTELTTSKALLQAVKDAKTLVEDDARPAASKIVLYILNDNVGFSREYDMEMNRIQSYAVVIGKKNLISSLVSAPLEKHIFFIKNRQDITKSIARILKVSYVECTGTGEVRDECDRVCQCVQGKKTGCYRLRKEVSRLDADERKRLYTAIYNVGMLKKYRQIHSKFVWVHENYMCTKIHNEDYFNPWHRWYIIVFENTLREMDCRITIPYWDWSYWKEKGDLFSKDVWREGEYELGGNGNMDRSFCVNTGLFREGSWVGYKRQDVDEILEKTKANLTPEDKANYHENRKLDKTRCMRRYFSYGISHVKPAKSIDKMLGVPLRQFHDIMLYIRYQIHGNVHMSVGGTMGSSVSADVPEFWLHHAFLDKLWWLWQERGSKFKWYYYGKMNKNMFLWPYTQNQLLNAMNMPKCIKYKYDTWPVHNITEFSGLDSSKFNGVYLENSVCDTHSDYVAYQDYMNTIFVDAPPQSHYNGSRKKTKSSHRHHVFYKSQHRGFTNLHANRKKFHDQ